MIKQFVRFLTCAFAIPAAASAQGGVEFGPLFAFYAPAGSYHHTAGYFHAGTPEHPNENRGPAWGAEARFWLNRSFGLQLQGVTSSVDHPTINAPGGSSIASSTRVGSMTAQLLYSPALALGGSRFWLSAGGGMIKHSGSAYEVYGSPTHPAGALGIGSTLSLSHGISAAIGMTSLLYHWDLSDNNGLYQRGFETDLLAHAGLTLSLR